MSRTLRPTTIIPPHLYVDRAADWQLDSIINDMGRPGYILVARQMGKTNLLINMKRRREARGDLVIYFDLSNRFDTARDLLRYLIDSILEADDALSQSAAVKIIQQRTETRVEANLEFDRHLRIIMRALSNRRLVLILDEIDSLISVPYSDVIFAQIRSMYFSRVNHPEYNRLTYVLSGVAEPTDLIKDKNISPFNIGEKIYLDDFTFDEFKQLISKASLVFESTVIDEIYSWTSGNPRLTWDLCGELEESQLNGSSVTRQSVVAAVEKLYLTRFDRAPVDHIRVLAETDPQIRSSVISIRWGKGDTLDERSRSRLYLAGICAGSSGTPTIKNKIIDAALSDAWLAQTAASQKNLLEIAKEDFQANRYDQVIQNTEDHLRMNPDAELDVGSQFMLAIAQYHEKLFEPAIRSLERTIELSSSSEVTSTCEYYLGSAHLLNGDILESLPYLERASEAEGGFQKASRLALMSALVSTDPKENFPRISDLGHSILSDSAGKAATEDADLVASALFNLAQAKIANDDVAGARADAQQALERAPANMKPAILLMSRGQDREQARNGAISAADIIIEQRLTLAPKSKTTLAFNEAILSRVLLRLYENAEFDVIDNLLRYAGDTLYSHTRRAFAILLHLVQSSSDDRISSIPLIRLGLERFDDDTVSSEHRFEAYRIYAQYAPIGQRQSILDRYLSLLRERLSLENDISDDDLIIVLNTTDLHP